MTNKDLISKLNNLKRMSPDQNWLDSNRELLLSQISNSGAENLSIWRASFINFTSVMRSLSQPAFALGVFIVVLFSGALFSQGLLASTKPNDSLYIARIISEKVKLNTIFNTEARNKLAVQYASEHAQDISAVLADPAFNTEENRDQVAALTDSFEKEVDTVKTHISRMPVAVKKPVVADATDVVIADSSKDGQGISLAETPGIDNGVIKLSVDKEPESLASGAVLDKGAALTATSASSTPALDVKVEGASDAEKILDEAKQLFDSKDYGKASDKLKEVKDIIK